MGVRLPAEYQEVEWIGSNNDAYLVIKNAVGLPEATNLKVKTTVLWKYVLTRQVHGRNGRCYFGVANGYYQNTQLGTGHTQIEAVANEWTSVEWSRNDSICTIKVGNDIDITSAPITATDPAPFALFALGDGSIRCYCALKETEVEIGSEQFDLIPCYRKQDSKPGMYDLASDTFFVNRGSKEFDIGPDVIDSISPLMVAWRRGLMQKWKYGPNLLALSDFTRASEQATWVVDDQTGIITVTGNSTFSGASTKGTFVQSHLIAGHTYEMHCKLVSATNLNGARFAIRGARGNEHQTAYTIRPTAVGEESSVVFTVDSYMKYFTLFGNWTDSGSQTVAYSDIWVKEILS